MTARPETQPGGDLTRWQIIGLTALITAAAMLGPLGTDFYLPAIPDMMNGLAIGHQTRFGPMWVPAWYA